jgi:hypothetical protein
MSAITITDVGRNMLRDALRGASTPLIAYVALGTDNTAPSGANTMLGAEVFRKSVTSYSAGATGEVLINMYLAPTDSVGTGIQEVGFFGGSSATSAANSGVLLARGLYSHSHVNTESIIFQLDLQL